MRQRTAFVVDDHRDAREVIAGLLTAAGFSVTWAADGIEAFERLATAALPDLVVTDLMMPRLSGWEFVEQLRAVPALCRLPVVAVSAIDFADARLPPFDAWVPKTYLAERLVPVVEAVLRERA